MLKRENGQRNFLNVSLLKPTGLSLSLENVASQGKFHIEDNDKESKYHAIR